MITPQQIRAAREAAHLTQTQAAELVGSAMRTWQDWEAGKRKMPLPMFELFKLRAAKLSNYRITCDDKTEEFNTNNPDIALGYYIALKQFNLNPLFYCDDKLIDSPLNTH